MIVDLYLDNAIIRDVGGSIALKKGEKATFGIRDYNGEVIFHDQDPVLDINHISGSNTLEIVAAEEGVSLVRFMSGDDTVKRILIEVLITITPPAVTLGLTAGAPIKK